MRAQIYRFHDKVAIHLEDGETVYLTEGEATVLATVLLDYAADIKARKFTESTIGTFTFDGPAE